MFWGVWRRRFCLPRGLKVQNIEVFATTWSRVLVITHIREDLSTGYGLRFSTEIYGSKRENKSFREYLQEARFVLT